MKKTVTIWFKGQKIASFVALGQFNMKSLIEDAQVDVSDE